MKFYVQDIAKLDVSISHGLCWDITFVNLLIFVWLRRKSYTNVTQSMLHTELLMERN